MRLRASVASVVPPFVAGGNVLGAKVASVLERRTHSAAFLTAGLFSIPAACTGMLVVNITGIDSLAYVLLLITQVCLWTHMSPLANLSLTVIPPELRARSAGLGGAQRRSDQGPCLSQDQEVTPSVSPWRRHHGYHAGLAALLAQVATLHLGPLRAPTPSAHSGHSLRHPLRAPTPSATRVVVPGGPRHAVRGDRLHDGKMAFRTYTLHIRRV